MLGSGSANGRLTRSANRRHAPGVNRRTGPLRSLVSRTSTRLAWSAISTHSPPLPELYVLFRQFIVSILLPLPSLSAHVRHYAGVLHHEACPTSAVPWRQSRVPASSAVL